MLVLVGEDTEQVELKTRGRDFYVTSEKFRKVAEIFRKKAVISCYRLTRSLIQFSILQS